MKRFHHQNALEIFLIIIFILPALVPLFLGNNLLGYDSKLHLARMYQFQDRKSVV